MFYLQKSKVLNLEQTKYQSKHTIKVLNLEKKTEKQNEEMSLNKNLYNKVLKQQELLDLFCFRPEGMGIDIFVLCNINKNIC